MVLQEGERVYMMTSHQSTITVISRSFLAMSRGWMLRMLTSCWACRLNGASPGGHRLVNVERAWANEVTNAERLSASPGCKFRLPKLTHTQVFYIPYIILELPSNYFFNRIEPRKFMGVIVMGWGCRSPPIASCSPTPHSLSVPLTESLK